MIDYDNIGLPHAKDVMRLSQDIAYDLALRAVGWIVIRRRSNNSIQISNRDLNEAMRLFASASYQVTMDATDETLKQLLMNKGYDVKQIDNFTIEISGWRDGNDKS